MERRDGATIRKERLQRICKRITKPGFLPATLDYVLANIAYLDGLTKETAIDYLKTLETLGFIIIDWIAGMVLPGKQETIDESNSKNVQ